MKQDDRMSTLDFPYQGYYTYVLNPPYVTGISSFVINFLHFKRNNVNVLLTLVKSFIAKGQWERRSPTGLQSSGRKKI